MIDLEFVEKLIRALDESSLDNLELERGGTRVRLSKSPSSGGSVDESGRAPAPPKEIAEAPAPPPALSEEKVGEVAEVPKGDYLEVTSPMVGTFYRSPAPDAPPYVDVGARVGKGTVLCIIEAMKLMNELEADVEGSIVKIMVEDAQPVEYGQLLFLIDPS